MNAQSTFAANSKIGLYTVERFVGADATGETYVARNDANQARVLLLVLAPAIASNPPLLQHLAGQLKSFAGRRHLNLAQVTAFSNVSTLQRWIVVSSLGEAVSLGERIAKKDLSPPEVVAIMKQCLAALQFAHESRILHGDLSPMNIWIAEGGKVKISGFAFLGISAEDRRARAEFQAPELLKGADPGIGSDVYALGIVFRKLQQAVGIPRFTPEIRRLAERMSTLDPASRFPSMGEALRTLGDGEGAGTGSIEDAQKTIARSFEKSKTIQLQVDGEIRRARLRSRLPSPVTLIVLAAIVYFGATKLKPMLAGKDFASILKTLPGQVTAAVKSVSGVQKLEDSKKFVTETKQAAEADMARRTAAADAVVDE